MMTKRKTFERHYNLKCKNTYWQSLKFYEAKIELKKEIKN